VRLLIQPIVIVHATKTNAGKPSEKEGKVPSEFDVLLQHSVEKEKSNEVNVEMIGLLTQLFSKVPVIPSISSTNTSSEMTENNDNIQKLEVKVATSQQLQLTVQQDELQDLLKNGQQLLQKINFHEADTLDLKQTKPQPNVPVVETSIDPLVETTIDSLVEKVLNEVSESNSNEQLTKLVPIDNTLSNDSLLKENTVFTSVQNQFQSSNQLDSAAKRITNSLLNANQFDQDIVKFIESAVRVQDLGDGMEAAFSLKPEQLGRVDVKVSIVEGTVTAEFLASTQSGKELLETHMQTLRLALETQGFQVDKIHILQGSATALLGSFSQRGDSNGRQTQSDAKKRHVQNVHNQERDYRDFDLDSGSQINTTA
jgi:flagellar hook-length control protein FliK